jgi:group II intron reverse transcriptase/maturase
VNWVLDADIQGFYDAVDHEWLVRFVEHRISDKRVIRHIKKWLNAGVMEDGELKRAKEGTPQGSSISPVLANIYLHYAFDLWVQQWRKKQAQGDMIVIRFADDIVVGFQYKSEAERFQKEMQDRLLGFNLKLHPEKTRLVEFGRYAETDRKRAGKGKPDTFLFLGFTHICGKTSKGKFAVIRKTSQKKMRSKLQVIKQELRKKMHNPVKEVGKWLASVLRGHYQYYGVPRNIHAMSSFRWAVIKLWHWTLMRRSQKSRLTWERMNRLARTWLPSPRITHPFPGQRLCVITRGRSPVR